MARVFTITPGLENMGGLKTGGQGSIYKGKRIGEIYTAIKILPTPIFTESVEDKNYAAFQNEVEKLKKVNATPNPNVVKILSSGISEAGNFPFIEMEYIEGPDLEEILQSAAHSVFTINETLKVAQHLSNALSHCHKLDVRHGDIKSNNIRYNSETGNYVLLDFGLAIMSDEQRRSSIRHTGAIEFMAPEQNMGQMLFQTDIYSFGVVLFELLAGTVPFKLIGKGETARNNVRLAHMANAIPDILELRKQALPPDWDTNKKERELQVPQWLLGVVYKCLEKKPEKRFADGVHLHNYIVQQLATRPNPVLRNGNISVTPLLKQDFVWHQEQLKKQLAQIQNQLLTKESELARLKVLLKNNSAAASSTASKAGKQRDKTTRVSRASFVVLLCVTVALGAYATYPVFQKHFFTKNDLATNSVEKVKTKTTVHKNKTSNSLTKSRKRPVQAKQQDSLVTVDGVRKNKVSEAQLKKPLPALKKTRVNHDEDNPFEYKIANDEVAVKSVVKKGGSTASTAGPAKPLSGSPNTAITPKPVSKKYLVATNAYFYNEPKEDTKRNEYISSLDKVVVHSLNERYGFVYVVITNPAGHKFKGWLHKNDLKLYSVE